MTSTPIEPQAKGRTRSATEWVGIVANAHSGVGSGRARVERLVRELKSQHLKSQVAWTPEQRQHLVEESRHDPRCRCLVAVGGDGTIGALVNEKPSVPLTVLPAGTENLFARHFGMKRGPRQVASTIAENRVMPLDVGLAGDRRFTLMAGIGFDADVVSRHHFARTGPTGKVRPTNRVAYVEPVLRSSLSYNFPPLTVQVEDPTPSETLTGSLAFVFNLPCYALGLPIAPSAQGHDGMLDLIVFRNPGPLHALRYLWLVFRGLHLKRRGVIHRRVRRISVTAKEAVPVQLDGDPGGMVTPEGPPWSAEVLPQAVQILVPSSYRMADAS